jgi:predicted 2-oxoglutarate/Fe(II)-dependent dioxygenase YbiX
MFIDDTRIFYQEDFLSEDEIAYFYKELEVHGDKLKMFLESSDLDESKYTESDVKDLVVYAYGETKSVFDDIRIRARDIVLNSFNNGVKDFYLTPIHNVHAIYPPFYMTEHYDSHMADVMYGIVIYLTDPSEYTGGELYYTKLNKTLSPAKGSIVIHPGDEEYTHGVKEVKSGLRLNASMFAMPLKEN